MMSTNVPRRSFITDICAGSATLAAFAVLPHRSSLNTAASGDWDMSWVNRLTGKYRAVFDSPDINDGSVFINAFAFVAGYREVYGAASPDVQPVLVMRGNGVHMAFNSSVWKSYGIANQLKVGQGDNPYLGQIASLRSLGAVLLACNIAATYYAGEIAKRTNLDADVVLKDIKANLAPGVVLQPSGVFATLRAQQAGCWFLKSA